MLLFNININLNSSEESEDEDQCPYFNLNALEDEDQCHYLNLPDDFSGLHDTSILETPSAQAAPAAFENGGQGSSALPDYFSDLNDTSGSETLSGSEVLAALDALESRERSPRTLEAERALFAIGKQPEKTKQKYSCIYEGCPYSSFNKRNVNKHEMRHAGKKSHKCEICSREFVRLDELKTHNVIHTEEKRFGCDYKGCTKRFKQLATLFNHKITHNTEKQYKCDISDCQFASAHKQYLKKHKKRRHKISTSTARTLDDAEIPNPKRHKKTQHSATLTSTSATAADDDDSSSTQSELSDDDTL